MHQRAITGVHLGGEVVPGGGQRKPRYTRIGYAEAHPESETEYLSWSWPDDQTLVGQANAICAAMEDFYGANQETVIIFANSSFAPDFLADYPSNQADHLETRSTKWLCNEYSIYS